MGKLTEARPLPVWDFAMLAPATDPAAVSALLDAIELQLGISDSGARSSGGAAELDLNAIRNISLALDQCHTYFLLSCATNTFDESLASAAELSNLRMQRIRDVLNPVVDQLAATNRSGQTGSLGLSAILDARRRQNRFEPEAATRSLVSELGLTGLQSFNAIRQRSLQALQYNGATFDIDEAKVALSSADAAVRHSTWRTICGALEARERVHAATFNGFMHCGNVMATASGAPRAEDIRHAANDLAPSTVDTLVDAIRVGYALFPHRYFEWKARHIGKACLSYADRLAPVGPEDSQRYSWKQARDWVLCAFERIGPHHLTAASLFFDNRWIDARCRKGKDTGGFCMPGPQNANPFVLINFDGSARSVLDLAHELGHGVHYWLARQSREFGVEIPFPTAEIAALFAERLAWEQMVDDAPDEQGTQVLMIRRAHDIANTVFRQMAIFEFERQAYRERREGPLPAARLRELYAQFQHAALGPAFDDTADVGLWYITVPHTFTWPFYTYAYAFGELSATLLAERHRATPGTFEGDYLQFQARGAQLPAARGLDCLGIDCDDPRVWKSAIASFLPLLDAIEGV